MSSEVQYDDLEYTPNGDFLLNGEPFSGLAVEKDDDGNRTCIIAFEKGREHGTTQSFFADGRLKHEAAYQLGKKHGIEREWSDSGTLTQEGIFEFGVLMSLKKWSPDGEVESEYVRPSSDHLYQLVLQTRDAKAKPHQ